MPKKVPTRSELDSLVRCLASKKALPTGDSRSALIPWEYTADACYARAQVVIDLLLLLGIPGANVQKQYVYIPSRFKNGDAPRWNYHVAVKVTLADGTSWILDPSLAADRALSLEEWIGLQRGSASPKASMPIMHKTFDPEILTDEEFEPLTVDCNEDKCITMALPHKFETQFNAVTGQFKITKFEEQDREMDITMLAISRFKIEKEWLTNWSKYL
jgi:hypothetical protein